MNTELMFSKASDEWSTPQEFYDALDAEFLFQVDAAATLGNKKCVEYFGPDHWLGGRSDALAVTPWYAWPRQRFWLNPPYSKCREFIAKAAAEARRGALVVALVPSRTDTRWWHDHVWDGVNNKPRAGVEVRFQRGRLKFGEGKNSAPFPSVVIVFRGADREASAVTKKTSSAGARPDAIRQDANDALL